MVSSQNVVPPVCPKSIVDGVDRAVAMVLEAADLTRSLQGATLEVGVAMVDAVHATILANYVLQGSTANKDRSRENWRWRSPQLKIKVGNPSREVIIEKAIIAACERLGRQDWANQVPVSSGLIIGRPDRRRAIDLVRRRGDRHFELIELKVGSNDPFHAAQEAVVYASLWLIARGDRPARGSALLDADRIDVRVLAPIAYYRRFPVADAEAAFDAGVGALGRRSGVAMTFAFEVLDASVRHDAIIGDEPLLACLEHPARAVTAVAA